MNNYKKEEDVQDTPEVLLANWNAQNTSLDGAVEQTAQQYNRADELFRWLEENAPSPEQHQALVEAHQINYDMAVRVTQMDAHRIASHNFVHKMFGYHQQIAGQYDEIADELDAVEHDLEQLKDEFTESRLEAYDEVFDEFHMGISEITGCKDWAAIYRLTDLFAGNKEPSDYQRQLLTDLVQSLMAEGQQAS